MSGLRRRWDTAPLSTRARREWAARVGVLAPGPTVSRLPAPSWRSGCGRVLRSLADGIPGHSGGPAPVSHRLPAPSTYERADPTATSVQPRSGAMRSASRRTASRSSVAELVDLDLEAPALPAGTPEAGELPVVQDDAGRSGRAEHPPAQLRRRGRARRGRGRAAAGPPARAGARPSRGAARASARPPRARAPTARVAWGPSIPAQAAKSAGDDGPYATRKRRTSSAPASSRGGASQSIHWSVRANAGCRPARPAMHSRPCSPAVTSTHRRA